MTACEKGRGMKEKVLDKTGQKQSDRMQIRLLNKNA